MAIRVDCEQCFHSFRVADRYAGKLVRCKGCGESVCVPPPSIGQDAPYQFDNSAPPPRSRSRRRRSDRGHGTGASAWLPLAGFSVVLLILPIALLAPSFAPAFILLAACTGAVFYIWGLLSLVLAAASDGAAAVLFSFCFTPIYVVVTALRDWTKVARPVHRILAGLALYGLAFIVMVTTTPPRNPAMAKSPPQQQQSAEQQMQELFERHRELTNTQFGRGDVPQVRPPEPPGPLRRTPAQKLTVERARAGQAPSMRRPDAASSPAVAGMKNAPSNHDTSAPMTATKSPAASSPTAAKLRRPGDEAIVGATLEVTSDTQLKAGQFVLAQRAANFTWKRAEILDVPETGGVNVHFLDLPVSFDKVVPLSQVRMPRPPDEVDDQWKRTVVFVVTRSLARAPVTQELVEREYLEMVGYFPGSLKFDEDSGRISLEVLRDTEADRKARFPLMRAHLIVERVEE